jgi:very-short-patch-repair endonuclease
VDQESEILRRAATRHGVITRGDALSGGLTDRQIRHRVESGRWERRHYGVYVASGSPCTPHQTLMVATLIGDGAASHSSAAWLHGLRERPPHLHHVTRSANRSGRDDSFRVHRVRDLLSRDLVTVDSITTTSATRTLLDLAATTSDAELRALIDRARRLGLTHPDPLIARFLSFGSRGRRGTARARRVLQALDEDLALVESDLEAHLLHRIVASGLPAPVPQYPVRIGPADYRVDFAYPDQLLGIEGDGFEFHARRQRFEDDRARQNDLVLAGWRILRFTWRQICGRPDWVVEQIDRALTDG